MEMFIRPNSITAPSSPVHYSVPSTPDPYGGDQYYISAPSSPSQLSHFYRDFDDLLLSPSDQRKPAVGNHEAEFAFDVNVNDDFSNHSVSSADELFHGGVIKPMQIPSREHRSTVSKGKDFLAGALSPRNKKDSTSLMREKSRNKDKRSPEHDRRGRERIPLISSSSRRSAARSLSPVRVSQYPWEEERHQHHQHQHQEQQQSSANTKPTTSSSISNNKSSQLSNSGSKGLRKWRLKDFFLFRSASEGRSDNKDPLRKYTFAFRKCEEVKGSSSKINVAESPGSGSGSGSVSKRKGKVSAHELHYTANRAVSEDLKKKTFLPYKQGILGRLAINPAVHGVGNGFGFTKK